MSKIVLNDQDSLTNESSFLTSLNSNWATLRTASDNTLSRDGTSPNQMGADLDMNSHRILNLLDASTDQEPVTLAQFHGFQEATLGDIQATLDFVFGSTPNFFMVRGASTWGSRAIVGSDLPTPKTTSLGGVFALSTTAGQVIGGLDEFGVLQPATTIVLTGTSSAIFAAGPAGLTNPTFQIDASAASAANGLKLTSQAATAGVFLETISSNANETWIMNAKGTGQIALGTTSSGGVVMGTSSTGSATLFIANNTNPCIRFGTSGNITGLLQSVGTGGFKFQSTGAAGTFLGIAPTSSTDTNYISFVSQSASNNPLITVVAGVSDNGLTYQTKGSASHTFTSIAANGSTGLGTNFQVTVNTSGGASTDRFIQVKGGNSGGSTVNPEMTVFGGGFLNINTKTAITGSDVSAFTVGKTLGISTPAFRIDTSTASAITGISIVSGATTTGVDLASIGDATTDLRINAAGAGIITLQSTGTGGVKIGAAAAGSNTLTLLNNTNPTIVFGSSGNVNARYDAQGSGSHVFRSAAGSTVLTVDTGGAASAVVNSMIIRAQTAGGGPSFIANGSDADITINFSGKGAGGVDFYTSQLASKQVGFLHTASANRYLTLTGSNGGNPTISTSAGDLAITPNIIGAGQIRAHNATAATSGGNNGTGFRMYSDGLLVTGGTGAPTISAAKGSLYLRTDGSTTSSRAYINTDGGTTWTAITTAA